MARRVASSQLVGAKGRAKSFKALELCVPQILVSFALQTDILRQALA
jgi:hypothetical protein